MCKSGNEGIRTFVNGELPFWFPVMSIISCDRRVVKCKVRVWEGVSTEGTY